jgi:hypothetical protein
LGEEEFTVVSGLDDVAIWDGCLNAMGSWRDVGGRAIGCEIVACGAAIDDGVMIFGVEGG